MEGWILKTRLGVLEEKIEFEDSKRVLCSEPTDISWESSASLDDSSPMRPNPPCSVPYPSTTELPKDGLFVSKLAVALTVSNHPQG